MRIRDHLAGCEACAREYAQLRSIKTALGGLSQPQPSADFEARLRSAVLEQPVEAPRFGWRPMRLMVASAALAAACTFAAMYLLGRTPEPSSVRVAPLARELDKDQMFSASADPFGSQAPFMSISHQRR